MGIASCSSEEDGEEDGQKDGTTARRVLFSAKTRRETPIATLRGANFSPTDTRLARPKAQPHDASEWVSTFCSSQPLLSQNVMATRLPFEIISLIAQFVSHAEHTDDPYQRKVHPSLVPFSLVCKEWQAAFEPEIYSNLTVVSPSDSHGIIVRHEAPRARRGISLDQLEALTTGPQQWKVSRRKALRRILYRVAVPHWLDHESKGKDDDFTYDNRYRQENDSTFETGMRALFSFLPQWASNLRLQLSVALQAENVYTSDQEIEPDTIIMGEESFTPYLADLDPSCCLPQVECILALDFPAVALPAGMGRENGISNRAALVISRSCVGSALEVFHLRDRCSSAPESEPRHVVENRQRTADCLSLMPQSVRVLRIELADSGKIGRLPRGDDLNDGESLNDADILANKLKVEIPSDQLCAALRNAAAQLDEIRITGLAITPDMFRPQELDRRWLHLKIMHLNMVPLALPNGEPLSYILSNRDRSGSQIGHTNGIWRQPYLPSCSGKISAPFSCFDALFGAIGEASANMPLLESLIVSFELEHRLEISMRDGKRVLSFGSNFGYSPCMSVLRSWKLSEMDLKLNGERLEAEYTVWPPQKQ